MCDLGQVAKLLSTGMELLCVFSKDGGQCLFLQNPGVGCLQLSREEETSWCILNSYLP